MALRMRVPSLGESLLLASGLRGMGGKEVTPCAPLSPDDEGMKHAHLEGWFILATTEEQTLTMKLGAWFTFN